MEVDKIMDDLDMLYDYYRDNNLAAGGYATLASRVKDDKIEKLFRDFTDLALVEAKSTAKMIISLGGKLY
jgi:hypothetical protein